MRTAVVGHVEWVDFVRVDRVPAPGEIVHGHAWWSEPGGGGPGAAVQLLKLAGDCTLFTALGDDELGHRAHDALVALGVRVEAAFRPEPQRRAVVHVDAAGERTITVMGSRLGASGDDALRWDLLDEVEAVYVTAGDVGAVRAARRARVVVATARALDVLKRAAIEIDALVGSAVDPAERYARGDLDPEPRLVVRTEAGAGGTFEVRGEPPRRYPPTPPPGPIVDAYGAGDSFAGGLTYGLAAHRDVERALDVAARCGAAALTGRGPFAGQLTNAALRGSHAADR